MRILVLLTLAAALTAPAQQLTAPDRQEVQQLYSEIVDLMEASAIVVPELARAGAPLSENARQDAKALALTPGREHVGVLYRFLQNAKVYLQLVDAMPKPPTFSADVRKQVEKLREDTDRVELYFRDQLARREAQLREPDRDNLKRYSEANSTDGEATPEQQRVVFLGDSITDGWQLNQYFPGKPYLNRGISGQITGQMLGRLKADVLDRKPRAVVLLGGTNDLARGVPIDAIQNNIAMIADLAAANDVAPVLASVLPVSDYHAAQDARFKRTPDRRPEDIVTINNWLRRFCEARGYVYLDYFAATVDAKSMLRAELANDGLHPNAEGYKIMAPLAEQAIQQALSKSRRPDKDQSRRRKRGLF
ncbi:MAG: capsular biosynthesis protein [Bryobacterales bacterium]|nr:SGNH/GDSL hydrolase family protein [Acidobacteriota bacterium]MCB9383687.1 capsular biosynthesis protein [Bryobacterales bacterium]